MRYSQQILHRQSTYPPTHEEASVHLAPRPDDHVIIDASRPSFLDSSGLAVLLAAATLAHAHGAGVHLAAPQPRVIRLL
ncbi:STAS domain-containing protein [Streptosporangium subroseum]|uniref:STAS domain-containing protein n=1 Tax=Streptosporangium subroseum TaxID=106412 RepID=UPI000B78D604